ncbi:hypothetical protein Psuf_089650 [Phytohabitans suffuscus]|uniref:DinB-like domain-containing protein n=1 Tax=Phytohabitans suffuscus TaxID=624315 RepID=A0A6F8YZY3_9ACTN|nr:DUF664 domain-containing protein [Phytohabitans suffuscus]BCB91652.1 hypothetical protein Psuf_089650 [Phytohabitans suffuscus]
MVIRVPFTGGEKESLQASLDRHREVVLWKVEGLDDEALRRPLTPSGTNLLGLVKHLAANEYGWFCETFGREVEPLPFDADDPEADLRVEPGRAPPTCSPSTRGRGPRPTGRSPRSGWRRRARPGSARR